MATSINSSGITFPDSTTQTTAVSGTGVPSTYSGVGSTISAGSSYGGIVRVGTTLSGAYLFYYYTPVDIGNASPTASPLTPLGNRVNATATFTYGNITHYSVGVGTWMYLSAWPATAAVYISAEDYTNFPQGIWRRIS